MATPEIIADTAQQEKVKHEEKSDDDVDSDESDSSNRDRSVRIATSLAREKNSIRIATWNFKEHPKSTNEELLIQSICKTIRDCMFDIVAFQEASDIIDPIMRELEKDSSEWDHDKKRIMRDRRYYGFISTTSRIKIVAKNDTSIIPDKFATDPTYKSFSIGNWSLDMINVRLHNFVENTEGLSFKTSEEMKKLTRIANGDRWKSNTQVILGTFFQYPKVGEYSTCLDCSKTTYHQRKCDNILIKNSVPCFTEGHVVNIDRHTTSDQPVWADCTYSM